MLTPWSTISLRNSPFGSCLRLQTPFSMSGIHRNTRIYKREHKNSYEQEQRYKYEFECNSKHKINININTSTNANAHISMKINVNLYVIARKRKYLPINVYAYIVDMYS